MWGYSGLSLEFPVSVPAWAAEPLSSQSCLSLEDFSPKFSQQCECLSRNKPKGTVSANTPNAAREVSSTLVNVRFQSQPAAPSCEPALRPCDSGAACRAPFPSSSFLPASQGVGVRHRAGGFSGKTVGLTPELFPQHTGLGCPVENRRRRRLRHGAAVAASGKSRHGVGELTSPPKAQLWSGSSHAASRKTVMIRPL